MQLNILVNSCTVELLNNGHITGSRPFVLHVEAVHLQKQRPTYCRDTTNLCVIHVYYIIVTIIIMHYNNSVYHGIYSVIIMIAIASLIVFAKVTAESHRKARTEDMG